MSHDQDNNGISSTSECVTPILSGYERPTGLFGNNAPSTLRRRLDLDSQQSLGLDQIMSLSQIPVINNRPIAQNNAINGGGQFPQSGTTDDVAPTPHGRKLRHSSIRHFRCIAAKPYFTDRYAAPINRQRLPTVGMNKNMHRVPITARQRDMSEDQQPDRFGSAISSNGGFSSVSFSNSAPVNEPPSNTTTLNSAPVYEDLNNNNTRVFGYTDVIRTKLSTVAAVTVYFILLCILIYFRLVRA